MQEQSNGVSHDASDVHLNGTIEYSDAENDGAALKGGFDGNIDLNGDKTPPADRSISPSSPRGTKRKLVLLSTSEHAKARKLPSPPWKTFEADRPSSFVDEGRRRSGRTNAVPLDAQPLADKRQTRAAYHHSNDGVLQGRISGSDRPHRTSQEEFKTPESFKNTPKRPTHPFTRNNTKSPSHTTKTSPPARRNTTNNSSWSSSRLPKEQRPERDTSEVRTSDQTDGRLDRVVPDPQPPPTPVRSLRLNYRQPPMPIFNPGNMIPSRKYASFQECLEQYEPLAEDGERRFTHSQVRQEALAQQRLERAAAPGGALSGDYLEIAAQDEPITPQTHANYLFAQVEMFQKELKNERTRHVREAKALAHAAAQVALERYPIEEPKSPKTEEELRREELLRLKNTYRLMIKQLQNTWLTISSVARQRKLALHEKEQEAITKQALGEMLDRSSKALENRKQGRTSSFGVPGETAEPESSRVSDDEMESGAEGGYSTEDEDESEGDEDSTSSEDDEPDNTVPDPDDDLTVEEIKRKYAERSETGDIEPICEEQELEKDRLDELGDASAADLDVTMGEIDPSRHELEEVSDILLDSSGDESESDGTEESEIGEMDNESDASVEESEEDQPGLLGFLPATARKTFAISIAAQKPATTEADQTMTQPENGIDSSVPIPSRSHVASDANSSSEERSGQGTPATTVTSRQSEREPVPHILNDPEQREKSPISKDNYAVEMKTKVPLLLRGQLREYQHYGLDWLAGMYANETNGILADEMGLGKTIQTIALLAHLATEKQIWGPHLIVVPTSVMLNWEMEFKKWCPGFKILTYYGSQEERKAKRRGWQDNDLWHVCITSYQLALQDQGSLKKRRWHYMVLDEAHNIKNFRSQRWQTLLSFRTEARLLLTGTPLQNNLSELWSLLFFLAPEVDEKGNSKFADLKTFSTMFRHPVEQILDHGRQAMDDEAKAIVNKLHQILRPYLLRRLKSEVEKQMPKKYEHIVKCRLSKRQRQLYDGYMGLAGTRESFASGNYMSIINCLMQLRKVCNHPDLFETRQIVTSYAMPRSAVADYEIKEFLVRRRFLDETFTSREGTELLNLWQSNKTSLDAIRTPVLAALQPLSTSIQQQTHRLSEPNALSRSQTLQSALLGFDHESRKSRVKIIQTQLCETALRVQRRPVYSKSLLDRLTLKQMLQGTHSQSKTNAQAMNWHSNLSPALRDMFSLSPASSQATDTQVQKYGCITPTVVAPNMAQMALTKNGVNLVRTLHSQQEANQFHLSQTRLSIAFPDKTLIQYDCGKLQQLDRLLRDLQTGGHRALIFTQMTKVLDILEQFMNLHGHRYLRLDGSTKVEQRQALTEQFNRDTRILAFILSSRSGGLGINLTGADTVIFYDLDWNPAMDKQCQDRCHRIGQTRDVHIYRFVSEGTIEANILRKSNQKRMLDDVVIQEGEFTTDVFNRELGDDLSAEADAALDKVLGGSGSNGEKKQAPQALEQAEDREDRDAAIQAQIEDVQTDEVDFEGKPASAGTNTPDAKFASSPAPAVITVETPTTETDRTEYDEPGSWEEYMLRFMEWDLRDVVIKPLDRSKKKSRRGKDQGIRFKKA